MDASHLSSSLLGRKAHGYTYLNARPDDTYPESRYEHVSTSTADSTESTESTEPTGADEAGEAGETDTDAEFDRLLSSVTPARRILVSSSGTHSVRSDRVAPYSLRIFRGL